jgi:molecular chaperone DnaK
LVYQAEKTLKDLGDKIPQAEKDRINSAKDELKKAIDSKNIEDIKNKTEELTKAIYDVTSKIYQQTGAQGAAGDAGAAGAGNPGGEGQTVDADYVVDDDEK